ncbi:MAG: hypothetical protein NTZ80_03130 [Patescibacteria group bacterium]|nr:hypothetical protein [Patescibacteria group bacterium]
MVNSSDIVFGPRPIDTYTVAMRSLLAFVGALGGGLIMLIIYLIYGSQIFYSYTGSSAIMFFLIGSFVLTMLTNLLSIWLQIMGDREKFYRDRVLHIRRIFATNVLTFILFAAIYFWCFLFYPQIMPIVFATQFLTTAAISTLIFDVLAGERFAHQGIIGTIIGSFLALVLSAALKQAPFSVFTLLVLPVIWFSLSFGNSVMESIAAQLYSMYGISLFGPRVDQGNSEEVDK